MPNLRGKTWTTSTPANVEDAQYWEDHLISDMAASKAASSVQSVNNTTPDAQGNVDIVALPDGGTVGQVLTKQSSADGDADWEDPASSGHTIQDEDGIDMPYQATLQFVSAEVTNDAVNGKTVVDCKGAKGDAATITVGTVTTLPAGSQATVVNSGTSGAAVFDFGIPKGADGAGAVDSVNGQTGIVTLGVGNLDDVSVSSLGQQQTLLYDGTEWGNEALADVALSGSYNDLSDKPTVDQTYSATSSNAQSGKAVAEAISSIHGGGMLPYLYIDSEAGATVTVNQPDGTVITPTPAGSGHWECELTGGYGTYVIHSVLSGQGDATLSLAVDTVKEYHVTDTHYDYTINVTAPSGSTVRIVGGGETYTGTGTGTSQAFAVHTPSTTYTVTATQIMDGNTKTDEATVTSAATSGGSTNVTLSIEFGTINVSVAADFVTAGSTITCVNGGTSCTPKTAASTLTFRVPTTGTWTISGEISGQTYSVEANVTSLSTAVSVSLQSTINVNVTMHGAVGAVITYTDANGSQTQTLDSNGQATNVSITAIANSNIVFEDTTVAKDPDNLANNYTKSVTITNGMTDIYVMPDNAIYWYGYYGSNYEDLTAENGWTTTATYGTGAPTKNTRDLYISPNGNVDQGIGTKNIVASASTANIIAKGITNVTGGNHCGYLACADTKAVHGDILSTIPKGDTQKISVSPGSGFSNKYISLYGFYEGAFYVYALWLE